MLEILKSASKIVLILFALAVIVGLFLGRVSEDTFKAAMLMVFTFYFATKSSDPTDPLGGK